MSPMHNQDYEEDVVCPAHSGMVVTLGWLRLVGTGILLSVLSLGAWLWVQTSHITASVAAQGVRIENLCKQVSKLEDMR